MESIIARLFQGRVYPSEDVLPQSQEFDMAKKERDQLLDKLEATLSKKQARILERMQDAEAAYATLECEASCAEGVRFGIQLMRELFPLEKPEWAGKEWLDE